MLHLLLIIKNKNTLLIDKTCPLNKVIHEINAKIQRSEGQEFQHFGENKKKEIIIWVALGC
jgi:4-hydroxy-3-methylbut-2-enyl diphosphate reductase IspH